MELINRFFKCEYKTYIWETHLDTEGKSKELFLEVLDRCLQQTREFFFKELQGKLFKENNLEIEMEGFIGHIFNEY